MTTSNALQNYLAEINSNVWASDIRMQEYAKRQAVEAYETSDGLFVVFEKENIKREFAFGYGFCGMSYQDDAASAWQQADDAKNNTAYFMRENLKTIDNFIERLLNTDYRIGLFREYRASQRICFVRSENDQWFYSDQKLFIRFMTETERQELLEVAISVRARRVKRLNTYLKRYGLSKVRAYAFLSD